MVKIVMVIHTSHSKENPNQFPNSQMLNNLGSPRKATSDSVDVSANMKAHKMTVKYLTIGSLIQAVKTLMYTTTTTNSNI